MMNTIGYRLSQFITSQWGTIKSISEEINTAPNLISTYVNNRSVPGGVLLSKLSDIGLNINWLLTGNGSMLNTDSTSNLKAHLIELVKNNQNNLIEQIERML